MSHNMERCKNNIALFIRTLLKYMFQLMVSLFLSSVTCCITILISVPKGIQYNLVGSGNDLSQGVIQSNLYYLEQDYPDFFPLVPISSRILIISINHSKHYTHICKYSVWSLRISVDIYSWFNILTEESVPNYVC